MQVSRGLASGYGNHFCQFLALYLADFGTYLWQWWQYSHHGRGGLGRHCDLCILHYHHRFTGQSRAIGGSKFVATGQKSGFDCDCIGSGQQWFRGDRS